MEEGKRIRLTHVASISRQAYGEKLSPGADDFMQKVNTIRQNVLLLRGKRNYRLRQMGLTTFINPNQATVADLLDMVVTVVKHA